MLCWHQGSFSCWHRADSGEDRQEQAGGSRAEGGEVSHLFLHSSAQVLSQDLHFSALPVSICLCIGLPRAGVGCCSLCGPGTSTCWRQTLCLCLLWKGLGLGSGKPGGPFPAQTCPLPALFSKCSAVLDVDSCPILCPVSSLSQHSQCRYI